MLLRLHAGLKEILERALLVLVVINLKEVHCGLEHALGQISVRLRRGETLKQVAAFVPSIDLLAQLCSAPHEKRLLELQHVVFFVFSLPRHCILGGDPP